MGKELGAQAAGLGWRKESTEGNVHRPPEHNSFISRTEMLGYLFIPDYQPPHQGHPQMRSGVSLIKGFLLPAQHGQCICHIYQISIQTTLFASSNLKKKIMASRKAFSKICEYFYQCSMTYILIFLLRINKDYCKCANYLLIRLI